MQGFGVDEFKAWEIYTNSDPAGASGEGVTMRAIIEISNDSAGAIHAGGQELAGLFARALLTGSDAAWDRLRPYGIS